MGIGERNVLIIVAKTYFTSKKSKFNNSAITFLEASTCFHNFNKGIALIILRTQYFWRFVHHQFKSTFVLCLYFHKAFSYYFYAKHLFIRLYEVFNYNFYANHTELFLKTNICDLYFVVLISDSLLMQLLCCTVLRIKKLIKIQISRIQCSFIASSLLNSNS